jgi:integrase
MPWYRNEGKILDPIQEADFKRGIETGLFLQPKHKAYCVFLYYSALRKTEALKLRKKDFQIGNKNILVTAEFPQELKQKVKHEDGSTTKEATGKIVYGRLKHGKKTPPLVIPLDAPFADLILNAIVSTGERDALVFPYSAKTAYNIVHRAFKYPHLFRLSRITNFFLDGWTIAQVKNWTGLTLTALEFYVGQADVQKMGESFSKKKEPKP